jgi:hypothetical protein
MMYLDDLPFPRDDDLTGTSFKSAPRTKQQEIETRNSQFAKTATVVFACAADCA